MPLHKLPLIINVQENVQEKKNLPTVGDPPPLTNNGYTTVTGIAKGHKGPCPH